MFSYGIMFRMETQIKQEVVQWHRRLMKKAKQCQSSWGMGFPVISITLLNPMLRELVDMVRKGNQCECQKHRSEE